jgi:hypothetical protein
LYLDRSEIKYDDGAELVTLRVSESDMITVESGHEAFSVNWTARVNGSDFIRMWMDYPDVYDAPSIVYNCSTKSYIRIPAKELLSAFWEPSDLGFVRLNLPGVSVAWQRELDNSDTVGCAMSGISFPFITSLFENTASKTLVPLTNELNDHLSFLRHSFKEI